VYLLQEKIAHVKGKMGASGREFEDRNRNMKEVCHYSLLLEIIIIHPFILTVVNVQACV